MKTCGLSPKAFAQPRPTEDYGLRTYLYGRRNSLKDDADFTRLLQDARTSDAEGWVIRDSTGYMVKIKAPGYSTTKRARAIPALVDYLREPSEQRRGTQADREKLERNAETPWG